MNAMRKRATIKLINWYETHRARGSIGYLSEQIGCTRGSITGWLDGKQLPSVVYARRITTVLRRIRKNEIS